MAWRQRATARVRIVVSDLGYRLRYTLIFSPDDADIVMGKSALKAFNGIRMFGLTGRIVLAVVRLSGRYDDAPIHQREGK